MKQLYTLSCTQFPNESHWTHTLMQSGEKNLITELILLSSEITLPLFFLFHITEEQHIFNYSRGSDTFSRVCYFTQEGLRDIFTQTGLVWVGWVWTQVTMWFQSIFGLNLVFPWLVFTENWLDKVKPNPLCRCNNHKHFALGWTT